MYSKYLKRMLDIFISLLLMPLVLIVIILVGPLIYLEDKGSIFYNANRLGFNRKSFVMYKLRTMKLNSDVVVGLDGSIVSSENDERLLTVGKLLRKTSLDELPQFINVLKGDMSIIGPRPTVQLDKNKKVKEIDKRYHVKPGITGYTQAYFRNSIAQEEKFRWDDYYVENLSFLLDVKIFFKTIHSTINRKNIY